MTRTSNGRLRRIFVACLISGIFLFFGCSSPTGGDPTDNGGNNDGGGNNGGGNTPISLSIEGIWVDADGNDVVEFKADGSFVSFFNSALPAITWEDNTDSTSLDDASLMKVEFIIDDESVFLNGTWLDEQGRTFIPSNMVEFTDFPVEIQPYFGDFTTRTYTLTRKDSNGGEFQRPAVTGVTFTPVAAYTGEELELDIEISPRTASQKVSWTVKDAGTTESEVTETEGVWTLLAQEAGTVIITLSIEGGKADGTAYTQDFTLPVTMQPPPEGIEVLELGKTSWTFERGEINFFAWEVEKDQSYTLSLSENQTVHHISWLDGAFRTKYAENSMWAPITSSSGLASGATWSNTSVSATIDSDRNGYVVMVVTTATQAEAGTHTITMTKN
jgi:hypothetical protein